MLAYGLRLRSRLLGSVVWEPEKRCLRKGQPEVGDEVGLPLAELRALVDSESLSRR